MPRRKAPVAEKAKKEPTVQEAQAAYQAAVVSENLQMEKLQKQAQEVKQATFEALNALNQAIMRETNAAKEG